MVVTLPPPECLFPEKPALIDVSTLEFVATPKGVVAQVSVDQWRSVVKRDVSWDASWELAKRCEISKPVQVKQVMQVIPK